MEKEKRHALTLTLAERRQAAARLISKALSTKSSANPSASLVPGLASGLADGLAAPPHAARLGRPLYISDAAAVIGCSPWTVRQKLIPRGLPHFRSTASGRLIFYEAQLVRWIEKQQGGKPR